MTNNFARWFYTIAQALLCASFVGSICVYSYKTYAGVVEDADQMPRFEPRNWHYWKAFPDASQKIFEDRIGWMHLQVRRFARFKLNTLGVSPTPRVWIGSGGWLYYNHEAESENYFAMTDPRLASRRGEWVRALPEWHRWLGERGIRLLIVVAPDKQSVYDEYLPPIERKRVGPTPLDVLFDELRQSDPQLPILDLRPVIRAAKFDQPLYFKTDTHWNPHGLFIGYQAMARAAGFEPLPSSAIRVASVGEKTGDLTIKMGYWSAGPEPFDHLQIIDRKAQTVSIDATAHEDTLLTYLKARCLAQSDGKLPRAVLFHDSFGDGIYGDLLAQHCSRLMCIPSNHMDPELIAQEKPDLVVLEIVERLFQGIGARRPSDPPRRSLTN